MSRYNPSRDDLSENPPSVENLLRGFHGRNVQKRKKGILPIDSLDNAQLLGRSQTIYYQSDKRDPKDPAGEGQQGYMKRFYHVQNPTSYLYIISQNNKISKTQQDMIKACKKSGLSSKAERSKLCPKGRLPKTLVELGILEKVLLSIGSQEYELSFDNYVLYVWDDMRTLMGIPIVNGQITDASIYIWCSKHTKVNWRGIID